MLQNLKHILIVIALTLSMIFGGIVLFSEEFGSAINGFFIYRTGKDTWQDKIYTHTQRPSNDIAIIRIDNESLNALQAKGNLKMLSIPKLYYVTLIEKLEAAGVKGIAFDIIFENADKDEELFAKTLSKYKNIVIASEYKKDPECTKDTTGPYKNCSGVPRSVYKDASWGLVDMNDGGFSRTTHVDISGAPYRDWKVGKTAKPDDLIIDTLPLALYIKTNPPPPFPGIQYLRTFTMNPFFSGPDSRTGIGGYQRISFVDALDMGKVSAIKTFQNKYVFIGESGTAIHDSVESPMTGGPMDGVETHAHYFDGLLQDKMLERGSSDIQTGLIILLVVVCVSLYFLLPGLLALLLALALPVLIIYSLRYSYDVDRVLFDIFPLFLAGSILSYPISAIYRFFIIDREKRQLKANFSHYVDPHVVDQIIKKGGDIKLGGDKKNVTVLFSDIAGFTTISEKLDPQNLFYLMSAYLSQMTDILIKEGGTLDKYIGDAVMGFFGAPLPYEDHSVRAARTALSMRDTLPDFNASILKRGLDPIDFRVGIASGEVMVGNIGSHDRFNYTVLGDTVNLASRLEGTGKEYNVRIILSAASKTALTPEFFVRELDTIAVKGKTLGVPIYELVGYSEDYVDRTMYTLYERALGVYRAGDYREAGKLWQSQAEKDPPSRVMMMRCAEILKGNLKIINGIYTMEHK